MGLNRNLQAFCPSTHALAMLMAFQAVTNEPLFPALRELHLYGQLAEEEMTCISLLAASPSSLNALRLSDSKGALIDSICLESVLRHVVEGVPGLATLAIQTIEPLLSLWSILAQFPALRTLDLKLPYSVDNVVEFASFAPLQGGTLVLYKPCTSKKSKLKSPANRKTRCSISIKQDSKVGREVSLIGHLDALIALTPAAIRRGDVTLLKVWCIEKQPKDTWEALVDRVSLSSNRMAHIMLDDGGGGGSIPLETLGQLMALDSVESLTVSVNCRIQDTSEGPDELFRKLCLAAKDKTVPLTRLRISWLSGERLSLTALQHVCDRLPHLLELEISLDSSLGCGLTEMEMALLPSYSIQRHPLQRLCLKDQRAYGFGYRECRTVALLFNQLFPDLTSLLVTVLAEIDDQTVIRQGWELIDELRRDYQCLGNNVLRSKEPV
jgi:hypothetical protein